MTKKSLLIFIVALGVLALSGNTYAARLNVPSDYLTIQAAVNAAQPYDEIWVGEGQFSGAVINKPVVLKGAGNDTLITDGVPYKLGFLYKTAFRLDAGADGTEICHFTIPNNANDLYFFAIFSRNVNEVSIHHLNITNSVQAISNYNGNCWNISHNTISGVLPWGGGGIGILVGAFADQGANDNIISHNTTSGEVGDVGYSGPGILLTSLHGASNIPGGVVTRNKILHNKCSHTGTNGVGFEADDVALALGGNANIYNNTIAFNDFRGSTWEQFWYGDGESLNKVSRNFGNNRRGDGLNPARLFHE